MTPASVYVLSIWTKTLSAGACASTDLRALKNQKLVFIASTATSLETRNLRSSLASAKLGDVLTMPKPHAAAYVEPPLPPGPTGGSANCAFSSLNHALLSSLRTTSVKKGHCRMNATL